jgi:hypothetical protein
MDNSTNQPDEFKISLEKLEKLRELAMENEAIDRLCSEGNLDTLTSVIRLTLRTYQSKYEQDLLIIEELDKEKNHRMIMVAAIVDEHKQNEVLKSRVIKLEKIILGILIVIIPLLIIMQFSFREVMLSKIRTISIELEDRR